jgi:hypothetical protein
MSRRIGRQALHACNCATRERDARGVRCASATQRLRQPRRRAGSQCTRRDGDLTRPSCFAPQWCAFCKKLEPEYATAADALKARAPRAAAVALAFAVPAFDVLQRIAPRQAAGVPVTLAMLDATLPDNAALAARFGVTGYPTLKMFRYHSAEGTMEYTGSREADGIVAYLTRQTGPVSIKLESAGDAAALVEKEDFVIVRRKCTSVLHAVRAAAYPI